MRRVIARWAKPLGGALVLLLGLTVAAPPTLAEPITVAPAKPSLVSATNNKLATMTVPPRALAQAAPAPAGGKDGKPFLKSKLGVAAILLMAVGTGYMTYSAFHDNNAVASPLR